MRRFLFCLVLCSSSAFAAQHVVAKGETAYRIAKNHNMTVEQLLQLNNLKNHDLKIGQVLTVSGSDASQSASTKPPVQSFSAENFNTPTDFSSYGVPYTPEPEGFVVPVVPVIPALEAPEPVVLPEPEPALPEPEPKYNNTWKDAAYNLMGTRYIYGGTDPKKGLDCSAFVRLVMQKADVYLPRTSREQSREGYAIGTSSLREGDLLFFDTLNNGVSHVGIYLTGGNFIHASSYDNKVTISSLYTPYYQKRFLGARRVLTASLASR